MLKYTFIESKIPAKNSITISILLIKLQRISNQDGQAKKDIFPMNCNRCGNFFYWITKKFNTLDVIKNE